VQHLTRLTKLAAAKGPGAFPMLPPSLLDLELSGSLEGASQASLPDDSADFSALEDAAFRPLAAMTALTRACFGDTRPRGVPPALSAATALRDLNLGGSAWAPYTGRMGEIVHLELAHLSCLPLSPAPPAWSCGTPAHAPAPPRAVHPAWPGLPGTQPVRGHGAGAP